jgi:DNA repair photolyase
VYCYAPEVLHTDWNGWRIVKVKSNITDRLSRELSGLDGTIGIGTVTDPYQYAEKRFQLTKRCLEILKERDFRIHMHTKSDLVLRDADLISGMRGEIGITLTTIEERFSKMTEPGAPLPERRLETLMRLTGMGIDAYALVGPVLNHLEGKEEEFVNAVVATGVKRVYIDSLNSRPVLAGRLNRMNIHGSRKSKERIRDLASERGLDVRNVF